MLCSLRYQVPDIRLRCLLFAPCNAFGLRIQGQTSIWLKQRLEFTADPRRYGTLPVDGPSKHGAAVEVLDKPSKLGRIAIAKLSSRDSFIQHPLRFIADRAELCERDGVKVRIGQIVLEPGEAVSHGLRRGCEGSAIRVQLDKRFERRFIASAGTSELVCHTAGRRATKGQQEAALGPETLDESRWNHTGFPGDIGKRELRRAAPLHHPGGGRQDFFVGCFARSRRHSPGCPPARNPAAAPPQE